MSLFAPDFRSVDETIRRNAPLAERMRPRSLEEFFGQQHLLGPGKPLRLQIERDDAIFFGQFRHLRVPGGFVARPAMHQNYGFGAFSVRRRMDLDAVHRSGGEQGGLSLRA